MIDLDELEAKARAATLKGHDGTGIDGVVRAAANHGFAVLDHITLADAHFLAVARDAVLELVRRLRETEDALLKATTMNIRDMNTVSEYNALYHREADKNRKLEAIVRDLAESDPHDMVEPCFSCGVLPGEVHDVDCLHRRAVESTR